MPVKGRSVVQLTDFEEFASMAIEFIDSAVGFEVPLIVNGRTTQGWKPFEVTTIGQYQRIVLRCSNAMIINTSVYACVMLTRHKKLLQICQFIQVFEDSLEEQARQHHFDSFKIPDEPQR